MCESAFNLLAMGGRGGQRGDERVVMTRQPESNYYKTK
jgi:hypothetical protein